MSNYIDKYGIHIDDLATTISTIQTGYTDVYGSNINVNSNSPDGQKIGIESQSKQDLLDFAVSIYNQMDVDSVIGHSQDILYKLNGIIRKASAYTFVEVNVTTNGNCNLSGLDSKVLEPDATGYTVSDTNGNNYYLVNTTTLTANTTTLLEFRAANAGAVLVSPNTVIVPVTIVGGVESITNPAVQYLTGNSQELDADFRIRRNKSTTISAQGFDDALRAQLLNLSTVTNAFVYVNKTTSTDGYGVPAKSIWCIVEGGTDLEVAQTIYANLTIGCNMKGSKTVQISKSNGDLITINFDAPVLQPLYIKATLQNLVTALPDTDYIKAQMVSNSKYEINESADGATVTALLQSILNQSAVPYNVQISANGSTWVEYLEPSSVQNKFNVIADNITLTVV